MALTPLVIDDFPGLDFRGSRVGGRGALLAHNVLLEGGSISRRPKAVETTTTNNAPGNLFLHSQSSLLIHDGDHIDAYVPFGTVSAANVATTLNAEHRFANFAAAGSSLTFIVNPTNTPITWNGSAFATPAFTGVTPTGATDVTVTPWDNRAVFAAPSANRSRVYFSDPGVPTTIQTDNYIDLDPGDGEQIGHVAAWRDFVFVFKDRKTYVFYATSTDSTGSPVFEYRTISRTLGAPRGGSITQSAVTVHRAGVFFVGSDYQIYRTTGGEPELVSAPISDIFRAGDRVSGGVFAYPVSGIYAQTIGCDDRFVYVGTNITSGLGLMFDTQIGTWTSCDFVAQGSRFSSRPAVAGGTATLIFTRPGSSSINYFIHTVNNADTVTQDFGTTNISARYRLGWNDFGQPGVEKELRDTVVHGFGSVGVSWLRDYAAAGTSSSLTLGSYSGFLPALAHTRRAEQGALFSLDLANTSGAFFDVHRVEAFMREQRGAGNRT